MIEFAVLKARCWLVLIPTSLGYGLKVFESSRFSIWKLDNWTTMSGEWTGTFNNLSPLSGLRSLSRSGFIRQTTNTDTRKTFLWRDSVTCDTRVTVIRLWIPIVTESVTHIVTQRVQLLGGRDGVNMTPTLPVIFIVVITAAASVQGQRQTQQPRGCVVESIDMCRYESHREMVDRFMRIQRNFPHIAKVTSFIQIFLTKRGLALWWACTLISTLSDELIFQWALSSVPLMCSSEL